MQILVGRPVAVLLVGFIGTRAVPLAHGLEPWKQIKGALKFANQLDIVYFCREQNSEPRDRYEGVGQLPLVGRLAAVKIYIHLFDHTPPHAHVRRPDKSEAMIDLGTLEMIGGHIPQKTYVDVREWMRRNHDQLIQRWNLAQQGDGFNPIEER